MNINPEEKEKLEALSFYTFIENVFSKIGDFIKNIFGYFGNLFVYVFYVIKKHYIIIGLFTTLGVCNSLYSLYTNGSTYYTSFLGKFSFVSGKVMSKLFYDINNLVQKEEFDQIAKILKISESDAKHIYGFDIQPVTDAKEEAVIYRNYLYEVDTAIYEPMQRDKYISSLPLYMYPFQEIVIYSAGKIDYKKVQDNLIEYLNNNDYLKRLQTSYTEAINGQINQYDRNTGLLDSLAYSKIKYYSNPESRKANESNIMVGESIRNNAQNEDWIFEKLFNNRVERGKLRNHLYETEKIAYVVSEVHEGVRESRLKNIGIWFLKGMGAGLILALLIELYIFLDRKQKKLFS